MNSHENESLAPQAPTEQPNNESLAEGFASAEESSKASLDKLNVLKAMYRKKLGYSEPLPSANTSS